MDRPKSQCLVSPPQLLHRLSLTRSITVSNNFWGRSDLGVDPLLSRMSAAKTTSDELRAFYRARADLEEEYAKKLAAISRKPLGSLEMGTLRASLDVTRGEAEAMAKQHALIAQQMKSECEEPLAAFAAGIKERRKIVQNGIERLHKTKQAQTMTVNKCRDKYEQDCLRIKGYLAQGHMVMGQEERKNKAKLEKTQINMASNSAEYEAAVKVLEETTGRWNKEWKAACDKFQDLEEERLDFTKSSLWAFANIASTVCVSDDASCEKIRLALEDCEVEKDIVHFIKTCGTGQEIPDPPRYINFAKCDSDTASEMSEDDAYAVAQFPRTPNPAFRSAESELHHTPRKESSVERDMSEEPVEEVIPCGPPSAPTSAQHTPRAASSANSGRPQPLTYRQPEPNVPPNYSPSTHGEISHVPHNEYPTEGMTMYCRRGEQQPRLAGSEISSASTRPPSRNDSDYSDPSSYTSAEPMSRNPSPTKRPAGGVAMPGMDLNASSPDKSLQKKRSGFFAKSPFNANSPFRRKSQKKVEGSMNGRNTWSAADLSRSDLGSVSGVSDMSSPTKTSPHARPNSNTGYNSSPQNHHFNRHAGLSAPEGEEPADPRAKFQLNIGNNVLDVASPDEPSSTGGRQSTNRGSVVSGRARTFAPPLTAGNHHDPVAQALANLKQSSATSGIDMSKRASLRQPVDAYHRVKTPAPDMQPASRSSVFDSRSQDVLSAQRGTPPPAYEGAGRRPDSSSNRAQSALGVPQPAFTSKDMRSRTENWGMGSSVSAPVQRPGSSMGRPASRQGYGDGRRSPGPPNIPRATSPNPAHGAVIRSRSPAPMSMNNGMPIRARSPAPPMNSLPRPLSPNPNMRSHSPAPPANGGHPRARSPNPMMQQQAAQSAARDGRTGLNQRPTSSYAERAPQYDHTVGPSTFDNRSGRIPDASTRRERSKSMAAPGMPPNSYGASGSFAHPSSRQSSSQPPQQQFRSYSPLDGNQGRPGTRSGGAAPAQQYSPNMEMQLAPSDLGHYAGETGHSPPDRICFVGK